jgi:site-specific recombinase XerD
MSLSQAGAETQPRAKTIYVFEKHLREFAAFAGGDLAKADAAIAAAWKRSLLERKTPKTTYNYLASCKAVLNWAEENRLIRHNPFDKVKIPKLKSVTKRRSYTDEKTVLILGAARDKTGWRRWLPWLLVFTGARITEICQLERTDPLR